MQLLLGIKHFKILEIMGNVLHLVREDIKKQLSLIELEQQKNFKKAASIPDCSRNYSQHIKAQKKKYTKEN